MFTPTLLLAATFGVIVAVMVGSNAMRIGVALGLLDAPDGGRKLHARTTPLVGGIAVSLASVGGLLFAGYLARESDMMWLAAAVTAMFAVGLRDDRSHLSPVRRLLAAAGVFLPIILLAPHFRLAELYFAGLGQTFDLGAAAGVTFTLVCLVGLMNAVNMADGKNGIVIGMSLVWTAVLTFYAPPVLWPALAATAAGLVVIWGYNMAGRLFLGDGGSYAVSAMFGLAAIGVYNAPGSAMAADDVALLFAVPVFDTIRLMVVRKLNGRSPFDADRDHLHHHIHARMGWPHGLFFYLALVAVPNAGALLLQGSGLLWLVGTLVAYVAIIVAMRVPAIEGSPAE